MSDIVPLISVVSPVYKSVDTIKSLVSQLEEVFTIHKFEYEIILVDDCCPDNSWEVIEKIAFKNPKLKGIRLSRNFGQHYAISAGLKECTGDWIVVMDCDLQDDPNEIIKLYTKAIEGFDIVLGQRLIRNDRVLKRLYSKLFYLILSYMIGEKIDSSIANFGIYNSKVIQAVVSLEEKNKFFPRMVKWVGFTSTSIQINHNKRNVGKSSYNFKKMVSLGIDIILSYSERPIRIIIKLGLIISLLSFLFIIYKIYCFLTNKVSVHGYTSIIVAICFFSGLIISFLGIIGLYLSKIFENVKNRPSYIVNKKINF